MSKVSAVSCCRAIASTFRSRARSTRGVGTNDVVLQNIKVLAIDQSADERNDKPLIAKSVTIEVDPMSAQKIALATTVGTLSLMLRKAGDASAEATRRITLSD